MQKYVKLNDDHLINSMDKFNISSLTEVTKPQYLDENGEMDREKYSKREDKIAREFIPLWGGIKNKQTNNEDSN